MRARLAVALAIVLMAGCTSTAIPTAPVPTIIRLTITPLGGGLLPVGGSVQIVTSGDLASNAGGVGAFLEYSDRTGRYVDATWRSTDDGIIAIEGLTLVGRGRGAATVTATFEGWTDTETFLVEGGIPGRWSGSYLVEQCAASSGSMAEIVCGVPGRTPGLAGIGTLLPIEMDINEQGGEVTAALSLNQLHGTLSGRNRGAGFFTLLGGIDTPQLRITFYHWDALVERDAMFGFIGYEVRINGLPGLAQVAAKLTNVARQ